MAILNKSTVVHRMQNVKSYCCKSLRTWEDIIIMKWNYIGHFGKWLLSSSLLDDENPNSVVVGVFCKINICFNVLVTKLCRAMVWLIMLNVLSRPQCLQMVRQKSTQNIPLLPYLMTNVKWVFCVDLIVTALCWRLTKLALAMLNLFWFCNIVSIAKLQ